MDWIAILAALGILGALGLLFGVVLGIADKKFAVKTDERVEAVRAALAGANCGVCGYTGCDAFAQAVVKGEAPPEGCKPGGMKAAQAIAEILGVDVSDQPQLVACVACQGRFGTTEARYNYTGFHSCHAAAAMAGGPKTCSHSCIGLGDCMRTCPFGAIEIINGVASINRDVCMGCGACANGCPRSLILLIPRDTTYFVSCSNTDLGREATVVCQKSCITCKRCVKACPNEAISIVNNIARIDPTKCVGCGACEQTCPRGCIIPLNGQPGIEQAAGQ